MKTIGFILDYLSGNWYPIIKSDFLSIYQPNRPSGKWWLGGNLMRLFFWSIVGGLVGTGLMDIVGKFATEKLKIRWGGWGGNAALGRWVLGIFGGHFVHKNIIESSPVKNEVLVGGAFHYFTGGSLALTYPLFYLAFNVPMQENHLISSLLWGLATVLFPWFILFPGFGWGFFGVRAPNNVRSFISPMVEHLFYGLGLGIVLNIAS